MSILSSGQASAGVKCLEEDFEGKCEVWDTEDDGGTPIPEPAEGSEWVEERFLMNCADPASDSFDSCTRLDPCPEGEDYSHRAVLHRDWVYTDGNWQQQGTWYEAQPWIQCRQTENEITEEQVRREVERFGLESGNIQTAPPNGKTLVNLDTIVWTEQGPYDFELEVAGTSIELMATPEKYHWDFGDGDTESYDTPGVEYADGRPMSDYHTHRYDGTGKFELDLTIDYNVRWNAGNGWQSISDTIPSQPDDPHTIRVFEKRDRLSTGR